MYQINLNKVSILVIVKLLIHIGSIAASDKECNTTKTCQENGERCGDNLGMCCTDNTPLACDLDIGSSTGICYDTRFHCVGLRKPCTSTLQEDVFGCCGEQNLFCSLTASGTGFCENCLGLDAECTILGPGPPILPNDVGSNLTCCPNQSLQCVLHGIPRNRENKGRCRPRGRPCVGSGQYCGGLNGLDCCIGFCIFNGTVIAPDPGGICE